MGSWGPKGPILVPYGTLVFLLIFSSKLAANEPRRVNLARKHFPWPYRPWGGVLMSSWGPM